MDIDPWLNRTEKPKLTIIFNRFKRFVFKNKNLRFRYNIGLKIQFDLKLTLILSPTFDNLLSLRIQHYIIKFF